MRVEGDTLSMVGPAAFLCSLHIAVAALVGVPIALGRMRTSDDPEARFWAPVLGTGVLMIWFNVSYVLGGLVTLGRAEISGAYFWAFGLVMQPVGIYCSLRATRGGET